MRIIYRKRDFNITQENNFTSENCPDMKWFSSGNEADSLSEIW